MEDQIKPKRSAPSYKRLYQEANKLGKQKDDQISKSQKQLEDLQNKFDTQTASDKTSISGLETEKKALEEQIRTRQEENASLEQKNTDLGEQLRKKELSRVASAYAEQETEYKGQQDLWFKLSLWGTGLLTGSIFFSIAGPHMFADKQWYTEPGFYLLNIIFLTLFIYALKQHAHFGNLRIDYANRKTLAQSYQYIIADEEETSDVKKRFLERAADVFSSKAIPRSSDVTIYEAIVAKFVGPKQWDSFVGFRSIRGVFLGVEPLVLSLDFGEKQTFQLQRWAIGGTGLLVLSSVSLGSQNDLHLHQKRL